MHLLPFLSQLLFVFQKYLKHGKTKQYSSGGLKSFLMIILSFQRHCQAPLISKPNTTSFCMNHCNSENPSKQWRRQEAASTCQYPSRVFLTWTVLNLCVHLCKAECLGARHTRHNKWLKWMSSLAYPRHVLHEYWECPFRWISQEAIILNNSFMQQIFQQLNLTLKCIYFLKGQNRTDLPYLMW